MDGNSITPKDVRAVLEEQGCSCRLEHIFKIQTAFADLCFANNDVRSKEGKTLSCNRIAKDAIEMKHGYTDHLVPWLWEMVRALDSEMTEVKDLLPWKHWSKTQMGEKEHPECSQEERLNHLRLEFIDLIHFIVEALVMTGLSADDVYKLYLEKNLVNIVRQEKAYNDANKTQEDNDQIARGFKESQK